jgi:serine/threonine protein kinase
MWAAGIISYQLIFGKHPFEDSATSRASMEQRLKNYQDMTFPSVKPEQVSLQARHIISMLCQKSIAGRFNPSDALSHPWITRKLDESLPYSRKEQQELQARNYDIE